ncbi:MAG: hypothetical protein GY773_12515 [Actinomycetia bacterium]|nr:hypothetical protein [Actinomycetes bacterium]
MTSSVHSMYTRFRLPGRVLVLKYTREGERFSTDAYSSPIAATREATLRPSPGLLFHTRLTTYI